MATRENKTVGANTAFAVFNYSAFTLAAASGTAILMSFDNGATYITGATATVPAAGYVTIQDGCTHVKLNAAYRVIGLVSTGS